MNEQEINSFLDNVIIESASMNTYIKLSKRKKIIGASKLLLGITIRSGVELFFDFQKKYLWEDALVGLQTVKANLSVIEFNKVIEKIKSGEKDGIDFKQLQDALVIEDFSIIKNGIYDLAVVEFKIDTQK